jgi:hypothetical protein
VMNIEVKEEFAIAMIMTSSEIRNTWWRKANETDVTC